MHARYTPIEFEDGFKISIQACSGAYCHPRSDQSLFGYSAVELGFPSEEDELISGYSEMQYEGMDYTKQVYPYVPATVVAKLIEKHGNIIAGTYPLLKVRPERIWIQVINDEDKKSVNVLTLEEIEKEYEISPCRNKGIRFLRFPEFLERMTRNYKELSKNEAFINLQKFVDEL